MNKVFKIQFSYIWALLFCAFLPLQTYALSCSNGLTTSFALVTLKTANFLNENSLKTLEDYASIRVSRLSKDELKKFSQNYERYALSSSFSGFIKSLKNARYWSNETRLVNASAAMTLLLINQMEGEIFSDEDIQTLWALQHINFIDSENTSVFNFSNNVVRLTGALKNQGVLNISRSNQLIDDLLKKCQLTKSELKSLYDDLYEAPEMLEIVGSSLFYKDQKILSSTYYSRYVDRNIEKQFKSIDTRKRIKGNVKFERNNLISVDAINYFHKYYDINDYIIIDKSMKKLSTMREGEILETHFYHLDLDDRKAIGGAGIYEIDKMGNLFSEDGSFSGAINLSFDVFEGMKVYILPANTTIHNFVLKNHRVGFSALIRRNNYYAFNYSKRDDHYISTRFELIDSKTEFKENFLDTLSKEKKNLMHLYKMDSNTYNELALFSYGVLALESKFGESIKYKIKQILPLAVAIAKGNGIDMSENSSGPSQIKTIPKKIVDFYRIEKSDLGRARFSAVATLGFSFELLQDLKRLSKFHKDINFSNIYDYLYYLYQGNRSEITEATATPNKSIKIKMIKKAASKVNVIDYF